MSFWSKGKKGKLSTAALACVVLFSCSNSPAASYIDDFDRELLGPDYNVYINPTGAFIQTNEYVSIPSEAPYQTLGTYIGFSLEENFSASVTARLPAEGSGGIAFNILNSGQDFYAFRAYSGSRSLQLIKYTGGAIGGLAWYGDVLTDPLGTSTTDYYKISVSSAQAGVFQLMLSDQSDNILFSTSYTDTVGTLSGGYAGIYADSTTVAANLFEVQSVPEPGSIALALAALVIFIPVLKKRLVA